MPGLHNLGFICSLHAHTLPAFFAWGAAVWPAGRLPRRSYSSALEALSSPCYRAYAMKTHTLATWSHAAHEGRVLLGRRMSLVTGRP